MNKIKLFLVVAACSLILGASFHHRQGISSAMGLGAAAECEVTAAAACARCGDGVCARKCENERTCPRDCGGTTSAVPSE